MIIQDDRISFSKYYTPIVEIKSMYWLMEIVFFDTPKKEACKKIIETGRNNDYTIKNYFW